MLRCIIGFAAKSGYKVGFLTSFWAIVNHPASPALASSMSSYFPYILYFVNFTISAAIRQGLFGSFENVIKDFPDFGDFQELTTFCAPRILCKI